MLGTPKHGWSEITIKGKFIGNASYLDFVPGLVLGECIRFLQTKNDNKFLGNAVGFNIDFDAEGYSFGIVAIGNTFYSYDDRTGVLKEVGHSRSFVKSLMAEAIEDIEKDFRSWIAWDAMDKKDLERNREELTMLLAVAKDVLNAEGKCTQKDHQ